MPPFFILSGSVITSSAIDKKRFTSLSYPSFCLGVYLSNSVPNQSCEPYTRFNRGIYSLRNICLISYTTSSEASKGTFKDTENFSESFSVHSFSISDEI